MIKADFELWADVKGYEGLYQVSTWGRVRSLDRIVIFKNNTKCFKKGRLLKLSKNIKGYIDVALYKECKSKHFQVHRLVAIAFIPNPLNLPVVNHKDENKLNNRVENLEWCTIKYNNNYGTKNKRAAEANTNGKCSKSVYQYDLYGNFIKYWPSTNEIVRKLGYNKASINKCCKEDPSCKTYMGYIWSREFKEKIDATDKLINKSKKPVFKYDSNKQLIDKYESASKAGKENNIKSYNIIHYCHNNKKMYKGFYWSYTELQ